MYKKYFANFRLCSRRFLILALVTNLQTSTKHGDLIQFSRKNREDEGNEENQNRKSTILYHIVCIHIFISHIIMSMNNSAPFSLERNMGPDSIIFKSLYLHRKCFYASEAIFHLFNIPLMP